MVTSPSLRKCAAIFFGLGLLLLAGCQKNETQPAQVEPTAPAAVSASPAPKAATPNSFAEVTAQLDPGGDFYLYLSTAQWLGHLSKGIDILHDALLSGSASQSVADREQAEKGFALVKDVVQKSGLEEITGVGASSFPVAPGLYRNKLFVHHYAGKGSGILWSLYGTQPHPLAGLDLLPVDTALASFGDFDLVKLINFLRTEADQSGMPDLKQAVTQGETQFAGVSGLKLDDVLASLNGSMGMVLTLDATSTISIPVGGQTIPTPRLAILIAVKNDLVFKQVDKMLSGNPGVAKVDEPDLRMRTMAIPMIPGLNLRPTVAQWNGFLVIASDDKLLRDMIAVQKGAPGYKSTPEYASLFAGLPKQGNSFGLSSRRFADTLRKFQSQMLASQPGANAAQTAVFQRLFSIENQSAGRCMTVGGVLPDGWLAVGQGSQGSSQLIAPMIIAPAAVVAGMAFPAVTHTREKATETASMSRERQLCVGCMMYANANNGNFPPSLDALFPTYLQNRSILASPFMPGVPDGYTYTSGLKMTDSADTVLIEDKFAPAHHVRIVGHVNGAVATVP